LFSGNAVRCRGIGSHRTNLIQISAAQTLPRHRPSVSHDFDGDCLMIRKTLALAVLALLAMPLWAADCSTTIEASDAMQFNQKSIEVPKTCKQFAVTLKHTGKLPKASMGHNWVLGHEADETGIIADGMKAGADHDYVKPDDARVITHTKLVGGGESDTVTIPLAKLKAGESYAYFCTFPGHAALMKGTLALGK
jgi:azurin